MRLVRYDPWRDMERFEDRMSRVFGNLNPWAGREERLSAGWEPAVDIYETEKEFVLKAELPDVEPKDVKVNVEGNVLTITGERREESDVKEGDYHRKERFYGTFSRSFVLPDTIDREGIKAAFKAGVMKLSLPKKAAAKPREITIEAE